jgi:hypothetical protein
MENNWKEIIEKSENSPKPKSIFQRAIDYFDPTSNQGTNFWSTPTAKALAAAQRMGISIKEMIPMPPILRQSNNVRQPKEVVPNIQTPQDVNYYPKNTQTIPQPTPQSTPELKPETNQTQQITTFNSSQTQQPIISEYKREGYRIPGIPDDIARIVISVFEEQGVPMSAALAVSIIKHSHQKQMGGNWGLGENPNFDTEIVSSNEDKDAYNAPYFAPSYNPIAEGDVLGSDGKYHSVDVGLWQINNRTFADYKRRMPKLLEKYGINTWEDLKDPYKNTVMAKIILQYEGVRAFNGAPATLRDEDLYLNKNGT